MSTLYKYKIIYFLTNYFLRRAKDFLCFPFYYCDCIYVIVICKGGFIERNCFKVSDVPHGLLVAYYVAKSKPLFSSNTGPQFFRSHSKDHNDLLTFYDNQGLLRTYSIPNSHEMGLLHTCFLMSDVAHGSLVAYFVAEYKQKFY